MECHHALYLLRTDQSITSTYKIVNKFLSEGCAVIYAIEAADANILPKSKFVNHVYSQMKQSQLIDDLEHHIQREALRITDIGEIYSPDRIGDSNALLKKWTLIIKEFRRKGNFKDIAIISGGGGATAFSDSNNRNKLVAYEQSISEAVKKVGGPVRVICCYLQESVDKMQFAQLASIVNAHQCHVIPIQKSLESRKIDPSIMLDAIVNGVEDVMGKGSGKLVMQTMKSVYKINEDAVVSNPSLFQEKLQKLLGNTSKIVLDSASKRISELILAAGIIITMTVGFSSSTFSSMAPPLL